MYTLKFIDMSLNFEDRKRELLILFTYRKFMMFKASYFYGFLYIFFNYDIRASSSSPQDTQLTYPQYLNTVRLQISYAKDIHDTLVAAAQNISPTE